MSVILALLAGFLLMLALLIVHHILLGPPKLWPGGLPAWAGMYIGPLVVLGCLGSAAAYVMGSPSWGRRMLGWAGLAAATLLGSWGAGRLYNLIKKVLP